MLNGKVILITGGSGGFGHQFIETTLRDYPGVKKIIIFSRDEMKQLEMQRQYPYHQYPQLRFFIGNVRDKERLIRAFNGVDIVIHAATINTLESTEYNPEECIKTNIHGSQNVIDAALLCGVHHVIALSSDKACNPISLYGSTQLVSDRLFVAANNMKGGKDIRFSVVRYGNVFGARGSVVNYFIERRDIGAKELPITDIRMTRFVISNPEVINMVYYAIENSLGGEIFVPKTPSYRISDMATAIGPNMKQVEVGIRSGEKIHEDLISQGEAPATLDCGSFYTIIPAVTFTSVRRENYVERHNGKPVEPDFFYRSDTNQEFETVESLRNKIKKYVNHNFTVR